MIEKLETFVNVNGYPIIRRCFNCKHWHSDEKKLKQDSDEKLQGYCKFKPMYFASTLQPTVYPITKEYYLCENHEFEKEDYLNQVCKKVMLKDIIKKKNDVENP